MSQFAFLEAEFPDIFGHASRAENLAHADPRAAAFYGRLALETAVGWLYRHDRTLKDPYEPTLAAHLAEPNFQALIGRTLTVNARFVKDTGNAAAHGKPVSGPQAATALREFFHVAYWLARNYARGPKPPAEASFRIEALPRLAQVPATTLAQLQEIGRRFAETVKAREAAEAARLACSGPVGADEMTRAGSQVAGRHRAERRRMWAGVHGTENRILQAELDAQVDIVRPFCLHHLAAGVATFKSFPDLELTSAPPRYSSRM